MKIQIISVGENKVQYLLEGESIYIKRLKRYCPIQICYTINDPGNKNPEEILKNEASKIISTDIWKGIVVAVDRKGQDLSTMQLAKQLQKWQNQSIKKLVFIIGSAWGLDQSVIQKADYVLSLSKLTFQHDMARFILLEQLYRCFTINRGEKYHK